MTGLSDTNEHQKILKGSFLSSSYVKSLGSLVWSIAELLRDDLIGGHVRATDVSIKASVLLPRSNKLEIGLEIL